LVTVLVVLFVFTASTLACTENFLIAISKPYFGPATESFLARQCKHLNIEVGDLAQSHLKGLAKWVEASGALIMDAAKAAEVAKKIASL
jgi:hypothetical protein